MRGRNCTAHVKGTIFLSRKWRGRQWEEAKSTALPEEWQYDSKKLTL